MNKRKKLSTKLSKHFCDHHLRLTVVKKSAPSLGVAVVQNCGQSNCPLPSTISLYFCPSHPCPTA